MLVVRGYAGCQFSRLLRVVENEDAGMRGYNEIRRIDNDGLKFVAYIYPRLLLQKLNVASLRKECTAKKISRPSFGSTF